jgi:hypothetical protein
MKISRLGLSSKTNAFGRQQVEAIFNESKASGFPPSVVCAIQDSDHAFFYDKKALTAARSRAKSAKKYMYNPPVLHESHAKWELHNRLRTFKYKNF